MLTSAQGTGKTPACAAEILNSSKISTQVPNLSTHSLTSSVRASEKLSAVQKLQARVHADLSARDRESPWRCSYALANMYRDGSEATGAHAGAAPSRMHCANSMAPVQACVLRTPLLMLCTAIDAGRRLSLPPSSALHADGAALPWKWRWVHPSASRNLYQLCRRCDSQLPAHADRITPLGKRPTIASLSIGATRIFRVKRASSSPDESSPDDAALSKQGAAEQDLAEVSLALSRVYQAVSIRS